LRDITAVNDKLVNYCEIELVFESANWTDSRLNLVTKNKAFPSLNSLDESVSIG